MKKQITKYGNSLVISFTKQECLIYDIEEGDVIDLSDMILKKEDYNGN